MTHIEMIGRKFGRLIVIDRAKSDNRGEARWVCRCDCGKITTVFGSHLRSGRTTSCGCYASECKSERMKGNHTKGNTRHNGVGTRIYKIWVNMKTRCLNPNNKNYQWYGAIGVKICDEWLNFKVFRDWALGSGYSDHLTIERIDPYGNYEPSNCTWIPRNEQNKNKRRNYQNDFNK